MSDSIPTLDEPIDPIRRLTRDLRDAAVIPIP